MTASAFDQEGFVSLPYMLLGDVSGTFTGSVRVFPGITTLVGPNGSGKTRALRGIRDRLQNSGLIEANRRKVVFLAAGRSSPFETFRAAVDSPGGHNTADAAVGHVSYKANWWNFESLTGSLLALDTRPDLKLKVEARLQQLFDRSVDLSWSQQGLVVRFTPMGGGGAPYTANVEASGILQIVALLAAIHNNEISALIIDEPEISLHPQHQAFLLEEMEHVAGDPADSERKLIVVGTHSPQFLPLRGISELPTIAFFRTPRTPCTQVEPSADILQRIKLAAFVGRLGSTHKLAVFADRVLLVEGPSDETIITELAKTFEIRLMARNAQVAPVGGKSEFIEAAKLFELIGKQVAILADLDALSDDNSIVNHFGCKVQAGAIANSLGRGSLMEFDGELRGELGGFITRFSTPVDAAAAIYADWSDGDDITLKRRRVTLARILEDPASFQQTECVAAAESLRTRYQILLGALEKLGCFFLRRGAIESYYGSRPGGEGSKPRRATDEAATFDMSDKTALKAQYADVLSALRYIAPNHRVDEDSLLRPKLGAVLSAAFLSMSPKTSDDELASLARATIGTDSEVFTISNRSTTQVERLEISIASPLFPRDTFPAEIDKAQNVNEVVPALLPGRVDD